MDFIFWFRETGNDVAIIGHDDHSDKVDGSNNTITVCPYVWFPQIPTGPHSAGGGSSGGPSVAPPPHPASNIPAPPASNDNASASNDCDALWPQNLFTGRTLTGSPCADDTEALDQQSDSGGPYSAAAPDTDKGQRKHALSTPEESAAKRVKTNESQLAVSSSIPMSMLPSDPNWDDIERGELVAADMKSNPACKEFAEKSGIDMETISGAAVHDAMVALGHLGSSGGVLVPVQENVGGPLSAADLDPKGNVKKEPVDDENHLAPQAMDTENIEEQQREVQHARRQNAD